MSEEEKYYTSIASNIADSIESKLFGKPCFKLNKKAFTCFFDNCMVFKLSGEAHSDALSLDGAILFDPSGKNRPMKEWIQVPYDYKDKWNNFAEKAAEYILQQ